MKTLPSIALLLASMAVLAPAVAQPPPDRTIVIKDAGAMKLTRIEAVVEGVDLDNRIVTLKGPRGNLVAIRVDEKVRNLPQLQPGDLVSIDYYQSLAIDVKKANGTPSATEKTTVTRAEPGEKPGGVALRKVHIVTEVMGVNTDTQTILVRGPHGNLTEVKVNDAELVSELHTGGRVDLTYVEGLAIEVREGPPK